jgi:hypothetical protein
LLLLLLLLLLLSLLPPINSDPMRRAAINASTAAPHFTLPLLRSHQPASPVLPCVVAAVTRFSASLGATFSTSLANKAVD